MDIGYTFRLEFLDLTDVDEYERNRVLTSLQPLRPAVKFPWFIGSARSSSNQAEGLNSRNAEPQNYVAKSHRAPITIVNPENGLVVPLKSKSPDVAVLSSLVTVPSTGNLNGATPSNPPLNSQYYSPVPQYYAPSAVVTTIANVPIHMSPNYGNFAHSPPSHPELSANSPVYSQYISTSYTPKTAVFYGVPPSQPIFVPHATTAMDSGTFYQQNAQVYVETPPPAENSVAPPIVSNGDIPIVSAAEPRQEAPPKRAPVSPLLSADTPAFTPKNQLQTDVEPQSVPVVQETAVCDSPIVNNVPESAKVASPEPVAIVDVETTPKQENVWGARKSWASLFSAKGGPPGSAQVNGVAKPAFPEAVTKESVNNKSSPIKNPRRNHFIDPECFRMGEFLKKYTVDGRTISLQPRGLINQSNYCYINSILQALIACPPMYNLLSGLAENIASNAKRKPTPVIEGMCKFVREYKHLPANMRVNNRRSDGGKRDQKRDQGALVNTDIPFEPSWIYKVLHGLQTNLMEGRQEDAEEFLGCLLNHLSDEMLELMKLVEPSEDDAPTKNSTEDDDETWQVMGNKNKGSVLRKTEFERTPITDIFGGSLKSRISRTGGLATENTQPFLTLPLNIEKVKTVKEALEALTTKYQLEGLTSSKTNEEVEAWQQVTLDELPVILILHLKCFDFTLNGCRKIVKALEFPIDLKIEGKLLSGLKTANAKEKQYKLFAVVYHDGKEATKGHYVTDAFHVGYTSWLRYDDASVKPIQEDQVLKPQGTRVPYLLFYRRSDTIRSK